LQVTPSLPSHIQRAVDGASYQHLGQRCPIIGAYRVIFHRHQAGGDVLRQSGRNLSSLSADKTVHLNGNRSAFHSSDAERQLLDSIEPIETQAAGCRSNSEISVALGDLAKA